MSKAMPDGSNSFIGALLNLLRSRQNDPGTAARVRTADLTLRSLEWMDDAMSPLQTALVAFACIFGGTFLGIFVRQRLPDRHLSGDTKDIVRQGTGLIATLASLVLGLLIASANEKFETENSQIK